MLFRIIKLSIVVAILALPYIAYDFYRFYHDPFAGTQDTIFEVKPGYSLNATLNLLHQQHQLKSKLYMRLLAEATQQATSIKAGEYLIMEGNTAADLLTKITKGQVRQYSIQFIEGWSIHDVLQEMNRQPIWMSSDKLTEKQILKRLEINKPSLEGLLFPDTYLAQKGMDPLIIVRKANNILDKMLKTLWDARDENLPYNSPYEALILASVVEKEAVVDSEREKIAGVFVRRLQQNMRLDSDPTVMYGLGPTFQGRLLRKHLQKYTKYNTYMNKGLPPTPIAMPSRRSLEAVFQPTPGKSLYFVAKGNGEHTFSNTLAEHNKAVQEYRAKR